MLQPADNKSDTSGIGGKPGDPGGPDRLVELLLRLQTTLDAREIMRILTEEIEAAVTPDGVHYDAPGGNTLLRRGRTARNAIAYRLRTETGELLGELRLSRRRPLDAAEQATVERLLGLGHLPLRNAFAHHALREQARLDPLTGLCNRSAFDERLVEEMRLARRHGEPLALLVVDIDAFKRVNDRYGHLAGDRTLAHVAAIIRREARGSDLVFRYAGDEFVICARRTDLEGARRLGERLVEALARQPLRDRERQVQVSVSVGTASLQSGDTPQSLFERADLAMYAAKGVADVE